MKPLKNAGGALGIFSLLWGNRDKIMEIIGVVQIIAKHLKNLLEDLKDDGKINGSNAGK